MIVFYMVSQLIGDNDIVGEQLGSVNILSMELNSFILILFFYESVETEENSNFVENLENFKISKKNRRKF